MVPIDRRYEEKGDWNVGQARITSFGSWRASPEIESSHGFLVPLPLQLALIYSSLCHRALICISRENHGTKIVIVRPELETDDEESYVTGGWWWIFGDEVL
jgi:hypothetical protein